MVSIYQFDSYKQFFIKWVQSQPKNGHGEFRRLALALNVSTTLISQVFNSDKDLSLEMACEFCDYLLLNDEESEFLLLLVEYSKAGSAKLKSRLHKQIKDRQEKAKKLENRLKKDQVLDESVKQIYYENWIYPAIRILTDIPHMNSAEQISDRLQVPKNQIIKALDYLIKHNLVLQKGKTLSMGPAHIYLGNNDTQLNRHLTNWRILGFNKMNQKNEENFFYSGQYALSEKVAAQIRAELPDFIEKILKQVKPTASETTRCLSLDFFEF